MNARSLAKARAHEPRPAEVRDRGSEADGSRRARRKVGDRTSSERVLPPVVSEIPAHLERPAVDVGLRPFIVAVANAIVKDILEERERQDEPSRSRLRKT